MKAIWKFKLSTPDEHGGQEFEAPSGAVALNVVMEDGKQPVVYLLCDRQTSRAKHRISLFATGANVPDDAGSYIGMIRMPGEAGFFVAHVFHRQLGVITLYDKPNTSAPTRQQ